MVIAVATFEVHAYIDQVFTINDVDTETQAIDEAYDMIFELSNIWNRVEKISD